MHQVEFDDNQLLLQLIGPHDVYLDLLEEKLSLKIVHKGNVLFLEGDAANIEHAQQILNSLYRQLEKKIPLSNDDIMDCIAAHTTDASVQLVTKKRLIKSRSVGQSVYLNSMKENDIVFALGIAGTGKTYLAIAMGISMLLEGKVERLILSRPAVETGENLGFLPGDLKEKLDPYLRPLYDALHDMLPSELLVKYLSSGIIEIAPLAYMRGRTLHNAFVVLDEGQNTTCGQMKMFLTRLGNNSKMVITGDTSQIDLPAKVESGLLQAQNLLSDIAGIGFSYLGANDAMRHPLVTKIVSAYARS